MLKSVRGNAFKGVVEIDESYFGPRRIRGKRGRKTGGKTIVFGIFKKDDKIYTEIVPDASKASLIRVTRGHVPVESVIHTDGWRGYSRPGGRWLFKASSSAAWSQ